MGVFPIVFIGSMFIITIAFLVEFFSHKRELDDNIRYGVFWGVVIFFLDGFISLMRMGSILGGTFFIVIVVIFLRTIMFVSVGNYHCKLLQTNDMPLTRKLFIKWINRKKERSLDQLPLEQNEVDEVSIQCDEKIESDEPSTVDLEIPKEINIDIEWKKMIVWMAIILIGSIAYSIILFKVTSPEASNAVKNMLEKTGDLKGIGIKDLLHGGILVFVIGLNEEIMFRLAIQNFFAKKFKLPNNKYWIAVVLTSALWALGHANTLNPEWVKFAQVFPLGIALGFLFKRFGIESTMIVHGLLNVIMMILQVQGFIKI